MNYIHRRYFISSSAFAIAGAAASSMLPWSVASRTSAAKWDEAPIDPAKADLIYRTRAPRKGEPKLEKLVESWITPTPQFYFSGKHDARNGAVESERLSLQCVASSPRKSIYYLRIQI